MGGGGGGGGGVGILGGVGSSGVSRFVVDQHSPLLLSYQCMILHMRILVC